MAGTYRGVIFDLDGTLLDSLEDLAVCTNRALAAAGRAEHPLEAYKYFVGDGVESLLARAAPDADAATVAALVARQRAAYAEHWHDATTPYPGVPELVAELARRGVAMAVLSNKPDDFTRKIVAHFFPGAPFAEVRGPRTETPKKPDPRGAEAILARFGLPRETVLYWGDTDTDMKTAKAAGLRAVGVTWGFRPPEELTGAGADVLLAAPLDALGWFVQ